ncbi:MAG: LamG domain-containing protein, partial [Verrucomicrobiales bacterium]|nr:LamG domain-containing protein [Verrucomicrobiales bacterium]
MKKYLSLAVLITILAPAGLTVARAADLVAYWDFEKFDDGGTTIKSTVGGYVGTVQGSPAIVPVTRPGAGGNGLDISGGGSGGYIVVDPETSPNNMVSTAAEGDAISIVFWEKNNRSPAEACCDASTFWFESPSSANGTRGVQVHVPWSNGEIMFDNTGCCTAGRRLSITPTNFDFEQWHHYAFIKNGETKQIWIDGNLVKEAQGADPLPDDFTLAVIGANGNADGHKSPDATIDDFALYKGALTEAEIKAIAAGAAIGGPPKAQLVAHWDFEKFDDGGTTIKSTVGGYVGTVQGSPAIVPITRPGGGGNGLDISGGGS